ncbi:MAG: sensor histidine kinase N-terminal domain-containing protein [Thiolinea sp.]
MKLMKSLKQRLAILMLGAVSLVWLGAGTFTWFDARHELHEVLDAHLAQAATLLVVQFGEELDDLDEHNVDLDELAFSHPYANQVAFQIFEDGDELVLRSGNAPATPFTVSQNGFSDAQVGDERWRVYSGWDREREILIHVAEKMTVRDHLAEHIAGNLLLPLLVALPALGLLLWLALTAGLKPLVRLTQAVAQREPQNLSPLQVDSPAEVTPLVQRLNHLFARITELIDNERRFTADAAHELRTPLASIKAQLQVAQAADNAQQRNAALDKALQGCDRNTHLISQLLTLARLESSDGLQPENCSLYALAQSVIADMAPLALAQDKRLELLGEDVSVQGLPALLQVLLRNLLDNAVRYTPAGTLVSVSVERQQGQAVLSVCDQGETLDEQQLSQLTRRFYRGMGTEQEGSGLGLSIVQRIADIHQSELKLEAGEGGGLCVRVVF